MTRPTTAFERFTTVSKMGLGGIIRQAPKCTPSSLANWPPVTLATHSRVNGTHSRLWTNLVNVPGLSFSRGAANGVQLGNLLPEQSTVYLWPQNDTAGKKWTTAICAHTKATLKVARIPLPHQDLNDWTRADGTVDALFHAMVAARTISAGDDQIESDPAVAEGESEADVAGGIADFPVDCLPPLLKNQVRAISALCGVPMAMSGPMVLGTASIAIGRGLRVRSLPGRLTQANLFVLVCKTSGSGGSLTFKHATAPLVGKQKTLRREFEELEKPRIDAEYTDV
jgi:hypothetical protein